MSSQSCPDLTTPGSQWSFCPNIDAAYIMCVFFAFTFLAHVGQGICYKKWYCWVICMSALWQTLAYIFRIVSIKNPTSLADYAAWFVLILVAPLWTNAFVYVSPQSKYGCTCTRLIKSGRWSWVAWFGTSPAKPRSSASTPGGSGWFLWSLTSCETYSTTYFLPS